MKQKTRGRGLFLPVFLFFFLLTAVIFVYGGVRYLMLSGTDGALIRVIFETAPALAADLIAWAFLAFYFSKEIVRPLSSLSKGIHGLCRTVEAGESLQKVEARGELGELSDGLIKQSADIGKLLQSSCAKTAKETEQRVKLLLAEKLYRETSSALRLEGEGFGVELRIRKKEGNCSDYADAFLLDSHTVFIGIGDIWGRGFEAALFVSRLKSEIRAGVFSGKPLGRTIVDVNRTLLRENPEGIGASIFAGIFSSETGELRFVNMGHLAPVVTGMYAGFLHMSAGTPVGLFEDVTVGEESFLCSPGQAIVFATEGVVGARDGSGNFFGQERYLGTVRAFTANPQDAAEGLLRSVEGFRAEKEDNAASLVLHYAGLPARGASSPATAEDLREDSENIYRALLMKARMRR